MVKVLFYKTTAKFYHISYQFLRCCNDKYWYKSCFVPKKTENIDAAQILQWSHLLFRAVRSAAEIADYGFVAGVI